MKDFIHRNVTLISTLLAISFAAAFLLFVLLLAAKEQRDEFNRIDLPLVNLSELPGPLNQVSERSRKEINVLLEGNKHVLGGYIAKIHYGKTENPIIHHFTRDPLVDTALANYDAVQKSGKGFSSAELDAASSQSAQNTADAKLGLITCAPLATTNIGRLAPGIDRKVKGVCRATIPPFDENVNLSLVVLIDNDGLNPEDEDIVEIRRTLLQLQIDIFNRDFRGRETWAHP